MARIYHPSPNCPCETCQYRYRMAVEPLENCREVVAHIMVRPLAKPRRYDVLVDLLDMPAADRAVLIEVIRGSKPLAQENL